MIEHETIDDDVEDFTAGEKIRFTEKLVLNGETISEAIIAHGTGLGGTLTTALFLKKNLDYTDSEEKEWVMEMEASSKTMLLLKIALQSDNLKINVTQKHQ